MSTTATFQTISCQELQQLRQKGNPELIDVRTPAEFREIHVDFARNVPLDVLDPQKIMAGRNGISGKPVYLICRSGSRGKMACEKFLKAGFTNIVNVEGGTQAWEQAGFAVVRGKKAVSLERQVRIAAGSLVLLGTVLGFFVHPYILVIPAFVGAGLIFSGVTDTCGMGMLLSKMPWNQVSSTAPGQVTEKPQMAKEDVQGTCCQNH